MWARGGRGWECYGDGGSGKVKEGMLKGVEEEGREARDE